MLWGWVDTLKNNYPCLPPDYTQCLEWQHVEVLFGILDKFVPTIGDQLFGQVALSRAVLASATVTARVRRRSTSAWAPAA